MLRRHTRAREVAYRFGIPVDHLIPVIVPWYRNYEGGKPPIIRYALRWLLGRITKRRISRTIKTFEIDVVHLNSIVLAPFLPLPCATVIHIREVITNSQEPQLLRYLRYARKLIAIDHRVLMSIPRELHPRTEILANPVVVSIDRFEREIQVSKPSGTTIFAVVGSISPVKGVAPIIKACKSLGFGVWELWIIGRENGPYARKCHDMAIDDPRIRFIGEVSEMAPYYRSIDVVIRGDPDDRIGRTHYEAVLYGATLVAPGEILSYNGDEVLRLYRNAIITYTPRSHESLVAALTKAHNSVVPKNRNNNMLKTDEILERVLQRFWDTINDTVG